MNSPKIDPEFKALQRELTDEERETLIGNIKEHGILSKLVVWKGEGILLDGHHRLAIANRLKLTSGEIPIAELEFTSRIDALVWAINNQLGRRNILPDEASELRGKRYRLEKKAHGGDHKSTGQNDQLKEETRERLAKEYGVSPKTIQRDAEYSEALDIVQNLAPDLAPQLTKPGYLPRSDVIAMAKDLKEDPSRADLWIKESKPEKPKPNRRPTKEEREEHAKKVRIAAVGNMDMLLKKGFVELEKAGREAREEFWFSLSDHKNRIPKFYRIIATELTKWINESYP